MNIDEDRSSDLNFIDPLEYASTLDDRSENNGLNEGRQYGYQRGYRQGYKRGFDYALKNHSDIALIYAYCEHKLSLLSMSTVNDGSRQSRLLNSIIDSCKEFRSLIPNTHRYTELLTSIYARYQHILTTNGENNNNNNATGTTTTTTATTAIVKNTSTASKLTF